MNPVILFIIVVDFLLAFVAAAFSKRTVVRLVAWFVIPVFVALLLTLFLAGPKALLTDTGESHGGAILIFFGGIIWGLAACSAGTLVGYLWRVFRILK